MSEIKSTKLQDIWTLKFAAVETARQSVCIKKCIVCCQSGNTLLINKAPMKICAPIGCLKCGNFSFDLYKQFHKKTKNNSLSTLTLYVDPYQRNYLPREGNVTGNYSCRFIQDTPSKLYPAIFKRFFSTIFIETHLIHLQDAQCLRFADR